MNKVSLEEIFHPRGIAVVGISATGRGTFSSMVLEALKKANFPAIYPVNPKYNEFSGLPCYPSLSAIHGIVDYVVVSIPAKGVLDLLDDCARKGVKAVQFFTAGFSESGNQSGFELERAMLRKAEAGGFRIIGPNCIGIYVPGAGVSMDVCMPMEPGEISYLSQSGGYAFDLPLFGAEKGLRFSKGISYGNAIDIDECELLEYFMNDAGTKIIAAYIEGVRKGRQFFDILRKNIGNKPVVLCKGGVTATGMRAAYSHTASMTSSVQVFNALCRQCNIIQVEDMNEMIDTLVILNSAPPLPKGKNVIVLGVGGGPTVMASDQIETAGLNLPATPANVQKELSAFSPAAGSIFANPIDSLGLLMPETIYKTIVALCRSSKVDSIIYHMGFHPASRWGAGLFGSDQFLPQFIEIAHKVRRELEKPVILALGPAYNPEGREEMMKVQQALVKSGLPVFSSLKDAASAIARVEAWNRQNISHL